MSDPFVLDTTVVVDDLISEAFDYLMKAHRLVTTAGFLVPDNRTVRTALFAVGSATEHLRVKSRSADGVELERFP